MVWGCSGHHARQFRKAAVQEELERPHSCPAAPSLSYTETWGLNEFTETLSGSFFLSPFQIQEPDNLDQVMSWFRQFTGLLNTYL
jgi:hypothetical protein